MANTFKSYTNATAVGTVQTTMYTVPASTTTVVIGFKIANVLTSGSIKVDVEVSGQEVGTEMVIPVGGVLEYLDGAKLVLETTETIKITSDTAASARVHLSYMEMT